MEQRITDKIDKVRNEVFESIKGKIPNISYITNEDGFTLDNKKTYFESAKIAVQKKKYEKDREKGIYWVPLFAFGKPILVCGLKGKEYPKDEASLLSAIAEEIALNDLLERQAKSMVDPKGQFIHELLTTDKYKTFDDAIDRGDILGINLRSPQAVILIYVPGLFKKIHKGISVSSDGEDISFELNKKCTEFTRELLEAFKGYEQNIFTCLSPDLFVCLKWAKGPVNTLNTIDFYRAKAEYLKEVISKKKKVEATCGVGQYYPGLAGLRKSFSDAKIALEVGKKIWGEGKAFHIVDIGMFVTLSNEISFERKCELADQIMGPVFQDHDLYKTVSVFLEKDLNLSEASKALHVHRNTLIYRLNNIKKMIGLDPRKFSDAVQLKLGLILFDPNKNCGSL